MKAKVCKKILLPLLFIYAILASLTMRGQVFNTDEQTHFYTKIDPTFTDSGFQFGFGIRKELYWGWVGLESTVYPQLNPTYWDLVAQGGLAFQCNHFSMHPGIRIGREDRNGTGFALVGASISFEYEVLKGIRIQLGVGLDHREAQKDGFYGDSDAHTYLIFSAPTTQENGWGTLLIEL